MRRVICGFIALGWAAVCFGQVEGLDACGPSPQSILKAKALVALSENPDEAKPAIEALRKAGQAGLDAFLDAHRAKLEQWNSEGTANNRNPEWIHLTEALDAIAGQRDCHASKLFWYTSLDEAKAAAKQSGKPILSLRLLGKLTDEFSCANSRFFRTTLYANEEVSRALRERFVLHWQSVRPVPKVTIDFGDGRKLERTLTGNSIHYILDSDGRVVDALPGLYGPKAFLRGLADAEKILADVKSVDESERIRLVRGYHESQAKSEQLAWERDLEQLGLLPKANQSPAKPGSGDGSIAVTAGRLAQSKFDVERPVLAVAMMDASSLAEKTDDAVWGRIAELHQADAELDAASIALMRAKNPNAAVAGKRALSKRAVEDPMVRIVRAFQNTVALDTVRNEYTLHRQLHEWFANGEVPQDVDVDGLNERVYAQLFLTPSSDPWLGLMPGDVYTALDNNGVAQQ